MSTINAEKDSPLAQPVLPPESFPFFENTPFFLLTLYHGSFSNLIIKMLILLFNYQCYSLLLDPHMLSANEKSKLAGEPGSTLCKLSKSKGVKLSAVQV